MDRWLERLAAGEILEELAAEVGITREAMRLRLKDLPGYKAAIRAGRLKRSPMPRCKYCGVELQRGWKICKKSACRRRISPTMASLSARAWGGRPRQGDEVQTQFWLTSADRELLERLGNGNMTEGLRLLIDDAKERSNG
jgi:hypothetical protein